MTCIEAFYRVSGYIGGAIVMSVVPVMVMVMVMVTANINKVFVVHQLVECCVLPR